MFGVRHGGRGRHHHMGHHHVGHHYMGERGRFGAAFGDGFGRGGFGGGGGGGGEWGFGGPGGGRGPGGRGPGGRGPGGGRRRMFDGEALKLILLHLIAESPRHGYELIKEIEARTGGAYTPSPGVVYPTLTLLDEIGQIEAQKSDGAKKLFAITEAGTALLAEKAEQVAALTARLAALASEQARGDALPIRRAMGNLRSVLQNRFGAGDVDAETLHGIADILDEAARKIERL